MLDQLKSKIDESEAELFQSLYEQIAFESIQQAPLNGAPFGRSVQEALEHVLDLGATLGFHSINHEGYVGTIDWGGDGNELIGVLTHVDVVSAGDVSKWKTPPFRLTFDGDYSCGRGVVDDKGPMLSVLYGLYALKSLGFSPKKRIRMIIGANEEGGWQCIEHYKRQQLEPPTLGFSPDGMFTVVNREKGIITAHYNLNVSSASVESITGGSATNMVPANATACLTNGNSVTEVGVDAHAMSPEKGENAIIKLIDSITETNSDDELIATLRNINNLFASYAGDGLSINCKDEESGSLTINLGKLTYSKGRLNVGIDVRTPVTININEVANRLESGMKKIGFEQESMIVKKPLFVPDNMPMIKVLSKVYQSVTGRKPTLYSIGGGTYARAFDQCVCFGSVYPDEVLTVHAPNERTLTSNIVQNAVVYGLALYELTK